MEQTPVTPQRPERIPDVAALEEQLQPRAAPGGEGDGEHLQRDVEEDDGHLEQPGRFLGQVVPTPAPDDDSQQVTVDLLRLLKLEACWPMITSVACCISRVQRKPSGTSTRGKFRRSAKSMTSAGIVSTKRVVLTKRAEAPAIITCRQNSRCCSTSPLRANMVESTISPPDSQSAMSGTSPTVTELMRRPRPSSPARTRASLEDVQLKYLFDRHRHGPRIPLVGH